MPVDHNTSAASTFLDACKARRGTGRLKRDISRMRCA